MATTPERSPHRQAGWYTDSNEPTGLRWWSGTEWVGHPIIETTLAAVPQNLGGVQDAKEPAHKRASNRMLLASVIAVSPLYVLIAWSLTSFDVTAGPSRLLVAALTPPGAVALLVIALAFVDRHLLRTAGHPAVASGFWILLTPIAYLSARAVNTTRHTGRGWKPFWAHLIVVLLILATVVGISTVYLAMAVTTALQQGAP